MAFLILLVFFLIFLKRSKVVFAMKKENKRTFNLKEIVILFARIKVSSSDKKIPALGGGKLNIYQ